MYGINNWNRYKDSLCLLSAFVKYNHPRLGSNFVCVLCFGIFKSVKKLSCNYVKEHTDSDVSKFGLSKKIFKRRSKAEPKEVEAQIAIEQ